MDYVWAGHLGKAHNSTGDVTHTVVPEKCPAGQGSECVLFSERELASCLLSRDSSRIHVEGQSEWRGDKWGCTSVTELLSLCAWNMVTSAKTSTGPPYGTNIVPGCHGALPIEYQDAMMIWIPYNPWQKRSNCIVTLPSGHMSFTFSNSKSLHHPLCCIAWLRQCKLLSHKNLGSGREVSYQIYMLLFAPLLTIKATYHDWLRKWRKQQQQQKTTESAVEY